MEYIVAILFLANQALLMVNTLEGELAGDRPHLWPEGCTGVVP